MRKRRDRDVPCVVQHRINRTQNSTGAPYKRKMNLKYGLPNYLPSKPISEDTESTSQNQKLLLAESKKKNGSPRIIDQLMTLTFHDRRQRVVIELQSLREINEAYPTLFDAHQVSNVMLI